MACIFNFEIHKEFFPCDLANKNERIDEFICHECDNIMRSEYHRFTRHQNQDKWDGDYLDFLHVFIEDRLNILEYRFSEHDEFCDCELNDKEYRFASGRFQEMYKNFFEREEKRFEAKVDSGQITLGNEDEGDRLHV